jgi:hypothetical protein
MATLGTQNTRRRQKQKTKNKNKKQKTKTEKPQHNMCWAPLLLGNIMQTCNNLTEIELVL